MGDNFGSTHWSIVLQAARADSVHARAALDALCTAYWYPLYAYVRRRGETKDDAADLTQDFFANQVATGAIFRDVFGDAVRFEISRTVSTAAEVEEEIRALLAAVGE